MATRIYHPAAPVVKALWDRAYALQDRYHLTPETVLKDFVQPLGETGARSHEPNSASLFRHDPDTRGIEFTITSVRSGPDRDGDVCEPRGADFTEWARAGAPILWGHLNEHPAIGSGRSPQDGALHMTLTDKDIRAWFFFDEDDFSDMIMRKVLRHGAGCSMAFLPRKTEPIRGKDGRQTGWRFL
jgi:hypothetical protein